MPEPGQPDPHRVAEVFDLVADLPASQRDAVLSGACGDDDALRREIERLLRQDDSGEAERVVRRALGPGTAPPFAGADLTGERVDRYTLIERIGEGGFGVVYLAEQAEPVRRRVAVKVVKPGMDSASVIARFEAERQSLALMDHPGIAKILDGGTTDRGLPYFVMEFVEGLPIGCYCDERRLPIPARLELFAAVCDAVQHAHQKGVIHRDIKPSNVLVVGDPDGRARPRIIDFGIAKAIGPSLTSRTEFTLQGQLVGTPEYMSPEQADLRGADIDTRTDVYALGALLYELLTGRLPFDAQRLREAGLEAIRRIIREDDPPRPSALFADTDAGDAGAIAARLGRPPRDLARELRRELEWIPLKALRKRPEERYQSAGAMADDVRRYLGGTPLEAGPESGWYRARKFVRRHRASVAVAATVATALVAITASALTFGVRERAARRGEAEQRAVAERINEFVNESLLGGDVNASTTLQELLDRAAAADASGLAALPRVEAGVRTTIGNSYLTIGRPSDAETELSRAADLLRASAGDENEIARVELGLAEALRQRGDADGAERILRALIDASSADADRTLRIDAMNSLAGVLKGTGRLAEAREAYQRVLRARLETLGEAHRDTLITRYNIVLIDRALVNELPRDEQDIALEAVAASMNGVFESTRAALGDDERQTLNAASELAWYRTRLGEHDEAEPLFDWVVPRQRRQQSAGWRFGETLARRSRLYLDTERPELAATDLEEAIPALETRGLDHVTTLVAMLWRAQALQALDRSSDATTLLDEAIGRAEGAGLGPGDTIYNWLIEARGRGE